MVAGRQHLGSESDNDENVSLSSGYLSSDLRDIWRYGCPKSHEWWDSEVDDWADSGEPG